MSKYAPLWEYVAKAPSGSSRLPLRKQRALREYL